MTREEIVERLKKGDRFYNPNTNCTRVHHPYDLANWTIWLKRMREKYKNKNKNKLWKNQRILSSINRKRASRF